ncbi:phosphorylase family protein [Kibdelosporangium aridum]|uniref:phosphorylase family protein n=1 Tax=Kibdelosporangium aridum TaxID=2030 RepID=UPI000A4DF7E3
MTAVVTEHGVRWSSSTAIPRSSSTDFADRLHLAINLVPDFPRAGVQFRDLAGVYADAGLLAAASTFFEEGAVHVSFADPYCQAGRQAAVKAGAEANISIVDEATMVVVDGPRFSSRAESQWYAAMGCSLVNMTGQPEAALARELALCYTSIALVTDIDAGIDHTESVSQDEVFRVFAENLDRLREVVLATVGELPETRECACPTSLDGLPLPFDLP